MIIPELLSKIYTDDIYLIPEAGETSKTKTLPEKPELQETPKTTAKPQKELKQFDHLVLSDIEPNPSQKELLGKILQAVGLNIEKIKIITGIEFPENIEAKNLISFNVVSEQTAEARKYEVLETGSGKILLADSLAVLDTDVSRKKALWQALQKMYSK
ncbi:MAG: DNA polymerase III subunit psi [Cytophagaceae bacterium]